MGEAPKFKSYALGFKITSGEPFGFGEHIAEQIQAQIDYWKDRTRIELSPDEWLSPEDLAKKQQWAREREEAARCCPECGRPWEDAE